ncbi:MAG: S41 family peptidase [Candidatus Algichlamydia australiensis]|nr:S41 family peptidase [Chlamydiales bacterium]
MKTLPKFLFFIALGCAPLLAKPADLTPQIVHKRIEEILKAHVSHKNFDQEVAKRALRNFLDELDPSKTYMINPEVAPWLTPSDELLAQIVDEYQKQSFTVFREIFDTMSRAVERRHKIEEEILSMELPKNPKAEKLKDLNWSESEDTLLQRNLKIRALQLDVSKEFAEDLQKNFMERVIKRRQNHEQHLIGESTEKQEKHFLTLVIKSVCASLDNHTHYFTPSEANTFMICVQSRLFGIGAQLRDDLNGLTIVGFLEDSPAQANEEIKLHDRIIAVNGEPVIGLDIEESVELIRGPKGSKVTLTVMREKEGEKDEKLNIDIVRDEVVLKEGRFEVKTEPFGDGIIGHLRLFTFYQDPQSSSAADLEKAIKELKKEHKLYGIILDLRGNAGGLLPQAAAVSGLFLKKGIVCAIKDSSGKIQRLRNYSDTPVWDGPLTVLVNRGSASASEIVAGALKDYGRALIMGDQTYGKGSYQVFTFDGSNPSKINPLGEFKVTRGIFFTASGKSPQLNGVDLDLNIPGPYANLEVGEAFATFPLENQSIDPQFVDELDDVHPFHRHRIRRTYKYGRQEPVDLYGPYLSTLRKNAEMRIDANKNYQKFLVEIKKEDPDFTLFHDSDLQLEEAKNVMKDLITLTSFRQPIGEKAA